jgi:hypothetical protein
MATFDFLENFFFISLAITFGLILLLVYHFKSRITTVEKQMDRMNEALTGVLKTCRSLMEPSGGMLHLAKPVSSPEYAKQIIHLSEPPAVAPPKPDDRIMYQLREVSDEDEESDDDEDTFDDEAGSDAASETDADTEEDADDVTVDEEQMDSVSEHEADETDDDVMDDVEVFHVAPPSPRLNLAEPSSHNVLDEIAELDVAPAIVEEETDVVVDMVVEPEVCDINVDVVPSVDEPPQHLGEPVEAETVSNSAVADETVSEVSTFDINAKEVYRKMSIVQLRTIAVSSGITADTTKMKKNDLIKLLMQL